MDTKAGKMGMVGTGLIGAAWAAFYASKGFAVTRYQVPLRRTRRSKVSFSEIYR